MSRTDPYLYPGENILINKFNCHDADELFQLEADSTAGNLLWLQMNPIIGNFDFDHLKKIHYIIFQDVYEWAGKVRTVDIGKGNLFCRVQFINDYAGSVFSDFNSSCRAAGADRVKFTETLASHYADMNALHPFREGNGRSQREFTRELCLKCGYVLDLTVTTHEEMLSASIDSFDHGNNSGLLEIFRKCVIPINEYDSLQDKLRGQLLILSKDDWEQ